VERDLALSVCANCGVVQLERPFPFRDLVPPFDWITYREPEDHLDGVAARIRALPGVGARSRLVGLSFKDRSTVERLAGLGLHEARMLDPYRDLGADYPNANIESVAGLLTTGLARELGRSSPADIVIARHVVEHAPSCGHFLSALRELLTPDGYLVIEVPDCSGNLARQDYTMIWEEHSYYFTAKTLPQVLARAGFSVLGFDVHPYPFEDVIVLYAQKTERAPTPAHFIGPEVLARNNEIARDFGTAFSSWSRRYAGLFGKMTSDGRKLAAYGAGHLTCAFLHFHGLAEYFDFVVDDTPQKQNLFLPKSGIPVVPRDRLTADRIAACLFGLSPQAEDQVISKNQAYVESGGKFYSIFADSERSIRALL
jgi:C-methyltransferase C-terminal domain/Methyltransferase domain